MLANLSISNFIIFDNIEVDFFKGFNAFTGETGAGKSMIIDAVLQLLGEKSNRNFVGNKKDTAVVQGLFFVGNHHLEKLLKENDVEFDRETGIVISRKIYNTGRSTAKINGTLVNINFLKEIREYLIDVHGQYEQQSILDKEKHIEILDEFIKEKISGLKHEYKIKYDRLIGINRKLNNIEKKLENKEDRIEFLRFQINEIEKADLKENEEEELFVEHKYLSNIDKLNSNLNQANYNLNYAEDSVVEKLSTIISELSQVSDLDEDIKKLEDMINDKYEEIKDIAYDLRNYIENIQVDQSRLKNINNRLSTINELKRKYKLEVSDIIKKKEENTNELNSLLGLNDEYETLNKEKDSLIEELKKLAYKIHDIRLENASSLEDSVTKELEELNMKNITFKISIEESSKFNVNGIDVVEFLISTNPGSRLESFSNILSGGEVSRIMLALKSILNKIDDIPTMIFDEIDTGISGKTAFLIGRKIKKISKKHQIICVTHSPQVAASADHHFKIEKYIDNMKAESKVEKLSFEDRVEEVARLLSGDRITNSSLKNSEELIINSSS
ncbi:MAG: DNA repair protein RecN [Bacillota bacterium]|nr:DNA repair protein RecN [Bacillota bacterium]